MADLPVEFTPDTVRTLPLAVLGRLARHGNGVLDPAQQAAFDAALHEVMSQTAGRVAGRIDRPDWSAVLRDVERGRRRPGVRTRSDEQLARLAGRLGEQVDLAQQLAPGVDWSFAQPDPAGPAPATSPDAETGSDTSPDTIADLEQRLGDQVELVQVMSDIADVSKRTYQLETQRDLQNTRSVFFAFVVSFAVLVAGWAPLVAAEDWAERWWIIGLTGVTCVLAGLVYAVVRRWQVRHPAEDEEPA